jgi:hypothetical protein
VLCIRAGQVQEPQPAPQAFFEILEEWNQMKCVISDMNGDE